MTISHLSHWSRIHDQKDQNPVLSKCDQLSSGLGALDAPFPEIVDLYLGSQQHEEPNAQTGQLQAVLGSGKHHNSI